MQEFELESKQLPFIYGTQYYRAPTPERKYWAEDLKRIAGAGCNAVKFWAQWRWSHRQPDSWYFDDLDELMDLAADNFLDVTINIICDTAPDWLFDEYPDAYMITASGRKLVSQTVVCRQIGGYPGPCFNHELAWQQREKFINKLVARYHNHPAMSMWDTWNEPESCLIVRDPNPDTLVCYCDTCHAAFIEWLKSKYQTIDRLNQVWGRCYGDFSRVELPRNPTTFTDMVDWRLFHLDSLVREGRSRIAAVKAIDSENIVYQHPVPNTDCFNQITGIDTFDAAEECDCYGGSIAGFPVNPLQIISSAQGRVSYAAEMHARSGMTGMYSKNLELSDLVWGLVPQIGLGIRGVLYWQYRCETLGAESPAWGWLEPNGAVGQTHQAMTNFWRRLEPVSNKLMSAPVEKPTAGIYLSAASEILHWCIYGKLEGLRDDTYQFTHLLYDRNVRMGYVNDKIVRQGLPASMKLLILPSVYGLDADTASAIAQWVEQGGTLFCEAHTGGYDLTNGRHCLEVPGMGLAEAFDLFETNQTAACHLNLSQESEGGGKILGDVSKAFAANGRIGGNIVPLEMSNGLPLWGKEHYSELKGSDIEPIAALPGHQPCIGGKKVGKGYVFYCGTLIAWDHNQKAPAGIDNLIDQVITKSQVPCDVSPWQDLPVGVRVDRLSTDDGEAYVVTNATSEEVRLHINASEELQGIMTDAKIDAGQQSEFTLQPGWADIVMPSRWLTSGK